MNKRNAQLLIGAIAVAAGLSVWSITAQSQDAMEATAVSPVDPLGPCTEERYLEYFAIRQEIGGFSVAQSRGFGDPQLMSRLREAFAQQQQPANGATFFVAHVPSLEIYSHTCESSPCTMFDVAEAQQKCLKAHLGDCPNVAVRYAGETYCTVRRED